MFVYLSVGPTHQINLIDGSRVVEKIPHTMKVRGEFLYVAISDDVHRRDCLRCSARTFRQEEEPSRENARALRWSSILGDS